MNKALKITLRVLKYIGLGVLLLIIFFQILPFLITPIYNFPESKPFSGEKLWNPYENIDVNHWRKGNFQAQSKAWGGVTDGDKNPIDELYALYESLDYDVIAISDYQKINRYNEDDEAYIPTYEHGYNVCKTHQVCIGSEGVTWIDFPMFQDIHTKQFIINLLKKKNDIVSIAHPNFAWAYWVSDMDYLAGYDLLEVLNHQRYSLEHWDRALSAGRLAWILANDDTHNIENPTVNGVVCTMINSKEVNRESIVNALKSGKAYGFTPYTPDGETYKKKRERLKDFPYLEYLNVSGNIMEVKVTQSAHEIRFIGQGGKVISVVKDTSAASYTFTDTDGYIRTEVDFDRKEIMYLNPVVRYSGAKPIMLQAEVSILKTILYRGGAWILLGGLVYLYIRRKKRKKIMADFQKYRN